MDQGQTFPLPPGGGPGNPDYAVGYKHGRDRKPAVSRDNLTYMNGWADGWMAAEAHAENIVAGFSRVTGNDDDLPGMWSHSDFTGGSDEVGETLSDRIRTWAKSIAESRYPAVSSDGEPDPYHPARRAAAEEAIVEVLLSMPSAGVLDATAGALHDDAWKRATWHPQWAAHCGRVSSGHSQEWIATANRSLAAAIAALVGWSQ